MKKKKPQGHYCRICGQYKANEKFSGRGHAAHICKACHALPVARRNELARINEIEQISEGFFISKENSERLEKYADDKRYPEACEYAREALRNFHLRMDEYSGVAPFLIAPGMVSTLRNMASKNMSQRRRARNSGSVASRGLDCLAVS
jgi:hypothetical protein